MTLITMSEVVRYSTLDPEDTVGYSYYITDAETEFFRDAGRTFDGTETDIGLAKRGIAILTAYFIRRKRGEIEYAKSELAEYRRVLKGFIYDTDKTKDYIYFQPRIKVVTQEDIGDTTR